MFSKRKATRSTRPILKLESLETRIACAVDVQLEYPLFSPMSAGLTITGLSTQVSSQASQVATIDAAGSKTVLAAQGNSLYSFQGNQVFTTDLTTGAVQSFTVQPLAGSATVQIRDMEVVDGALVIVGESVPAGQGASPIPTQWNSSGTPTRIGPAGMSGSARVIDHGAIGGYLLSSSAEYQPWIRSNGVDLLLPRTDAPLEFQTVQSIADNLAYVVGSSLHQTDAGMLLQPISWFQSSNGDQPEFVLDLGTEFVFLELPENAGVDNNGASFLTEFDSNSESNIFGEFTKTLLDDQGQVIGTERHAAMWSEFGTLVADFGVGTEVLDVQLLGSSYFVAHDDSISVVTNGIVSKITLASLLGNLVPAGGTQTIVRNGLLTTGSGASTKLMVNFADTRGSTTSSKLAVVGVDVPVALAIDYDGDGTFEVDQQSLSYNNSIEIQDFGPQSVKVRVTYANGSVQNASAPLNATPFWVDTQTETSLYIGGSFRDDVAILQGNGAKSYSALIRTYSDSFTAIDQVLVDLGTGDDTLLLNQGVAYDLNWLSNVENLDLSNETSETLSNISETNVVFLVGTEAPLNISLDSSDHLIFDGIWTLERPQEAEGKITSRLTKGDAAVLLNLNAFVNVIQPLDSNFDGSVSAIDALLVINYLNTAVGGNSPTVDAFIDVNGDGTISALDVLLIINFINTNPPALEGEAVAIASATPTATSTDSANTQAAYFDIDSLPNDRRRNRFGGR